ncbi:MAG TPA: HEAT repeat domain-containing protein [Myxococcota bacterium]|nr:HEAT repeat domain-containing protein [Myxococcota bacterium]
MTHPILERLHSAEPDVRADACREALDDPSALLLIDALGDALGDPVDAVALAASDALARLAREVDGVGRVLQRALRSDDASRRWHAALTSARIEPPAPRLLPAIVEALASPSRERRWTAARLLVETGRMHPEVLKLALGLATTSESARVREMAIHCARELGADVTEAADALLAATRDRDRSVRRAALTALAALEDPPCKVYAKLVDLLDDASDGISRALAARALCALARTAAREPPDAAIAALRRLADADPDAELRAGAARALQSVARAANAGE